MKVSLNLAQEFSNVDLKSIPRDELVKRVGAQLGAIEEIIDWAPKFEGAVIVKVVECKKHDNADKLSICRIDDGGKTEGVERGEDGLIQVVCGAPNVHADMFAVWLGPGVTVPSSRDTDPFVLEAREIRGVVSNGMLASASELGISDDHSGIVEVEESDALRYQISDIKYSHLEPGMALTELYGLDDFVIDCENKMFTHRPDCFGVLGVARELAGISGLEFKSPDWYLEPIANIDGPFSELPLESKCDTKLVPRFTARVVEGVSVHKSPMWLQAVLARVGVKSINNLVDWTNYYMHLTGQPTHAFDYDKIRALCGEKTTIFPRHAQKGEKLTLLGGKTIELHEDDLVIATDKQPVALAGIMGGADTEVDENTKNIIIECANFNMYAVRKSSMRHGLFTDASTRFTKGQSPYQNLRVLHKLTEDIVAQTGARPGKMVDIVDCDVIDTGEVGYSNEVSVGVEFINERLGSDLTADDIARLLTNVEFLVAQQETDLKVSVPFWRTDIELPEDIVEEVGRLYGYDKLPVELPKRSAKPTPKNQLAEFKQHLRFALKETGANEVLTYSFVHGDLMRRTGTDPERWAYHIRNAISPDLQYYRTSLMPSLLGKVHPNIKAQAGDDNNQFAIFEIGKAHVTDQKENGLPVQMERLGLVVSADDKTARTKQSGAAFYLAKKYLDQVTDNQAVYEELDNTDYPISAPYQTGRSAIVSVNGEVLGVIGEFNAAVRSKLKLPEFTAGFELDIEALKKYLRPKSYQPLPQYPSIQQDLTLELDAATSFSNVRRALAASLLEKSEEHGYDWQLAAKDIYQPEGSEKKRLTFRIEVSHPSKTLKTEEATALTDAVADALQSGLNAQRV